MVGIWFVSFNRVVMIQLIGTKTVSPQYHVNAMTISPMCSSGLYRNIFPVCFTNSQQRGIISGIALNVWGLPDLRRAIMSVNAVYDIGFSKGVIIELCIPIHYFISLMGDLFVVIYRLLDCVPTELEMLSWQSPATKHTNNYRSDGWTEYLQRKQNRMPYYWQKNTIWEIELEG